MDTYSVFRYIKRVKWIIYYKKAIFLLYISINLNVKKSNKCGLVQNGRNVRVHFYEKFLSISKVSKLNYYFLINIGNVERDVK